MDVVYVVGRGDRNPELRYSLRSLTNLPHDEVWIAGYTPSWVTGVQSIPVEQDLGDRFSNSTANMAAACRHAQVSDPFIYLNDDFFVMRTVDEVPALHLGPVDGMLRRWGGSSYARGAMATRDLLVSLGYADPVSYEIHAPMVVYKAAMREALHIGRHVHPLHKRTLYGHLARLGGQKTQDVKVINTNGSWPDDAPFLSTTDMTFKYGRVGHHIQSQFRTRSIYEVSPMTDADREREELFAEADRLGIKVAHNARSDTIRRKIAEATEAEPVPEPIGPSEPIAEATVTDEPPAPVGKTRTWINAQGLRKSARRGSGLDRWYAASPDWAPF